MLSIEAHRLVTVNHSIIILLQIILKVYYEIHFAKYNVGFVLANTIHGLVGHQTSKASAGDYIICS